MKTFLAIFCALVVHETVHADDPKHMIGLSGLYGLHQTGIVQVREYEVYGDRLQLHEDLGLDVFMGLSFAYGYRLKSGWLDAEYTQYILRGKENAHTEFNFNGATYAPGETDIGKTRYRKATFLYKHMMSGTRTSNDRYMIGGGLSVETLKFFIDGELSPSTTRREKFESFDTQVVPVPTFYADWRKSITPLTGYGFELSSAWLPKSKTPYKEKGNIYFEQFNFDARAKISWLFEGQNLTAGYYYKYFFQKGESWEDTNEFRISSSGLFVESHWFF